MPPVIKQFLLFTWICISLQSSECRRIDCIHDQIQPKKVVAANINYIGSNANKHSREKRSTDSLYQPMRINVHYSNLDYQLEDHEINRLKRIIKETTTKISNILSVIPVKGKLLLSRSDRSCTGVILRGINKNKCSQVGSVSHETCLGNFRIPQEHLEGLFIYNFTHPGPVKVVWEEGAGVENTDYILYVTSISNSRCSSAGNNVIAYAAYCQVDQNSRPIAGYINICPQLLRTQENDDKVSITSLHEFFHALGFTSELFDKFRDCSNATIIGNTISCPTWRKPVREVLGSYHLVTPRLVEIASKHYDCTTHEEFNEFGPRLQDVFGKAGSHWDAAFLQGSLMAPNIGLPELTRLDPITLMAFAEMGWYKVNFDFAEHYVWGEGEGCSFSSSPECLKDTDFFCKKRSENYQWLTLHGCHYLHQHKGLCNTNHFLHTCTVFQATSQGNCRDTANQKHAEGDEKFQPDSRCFVANLTKEANVSEAEEARCYQHQCVGGSLQVKVGSAPWTTCPYGDTIQVPGYQGTIQCPRTGILCVPPKPAPLITEIPDTTKLTSTRPTLPRYDPDAETYNVNISFPDVNYVWLESQNSLPLFKEKVKSAVAHEVSISEQRMSMVRVYRVPWVVVGFTLLPSLYAEDGPPSDVVYAQLQELIKEGKLTVTVREGGKTYIASSIHQSVGGPTYSSTAPTAGVIVGMVVGSLLAMLIFAALVFVVQRYYAVHSRVLPNHARAQDARALPVRPQPPPSDGDPHQIARSALSTSDVNLEDGHSFSDFSDSP